MTCSVLNHFRMENRELLICQSALYLQYELNSSKVNKHVNAAVYFHLNKVQSKTGDLVHTWNTHQPSSKPARLDTSAKPTRLEGLIWSTFNEKSITQASTTQLMRSKLSFLSHYQIKYPATSTKKISRTIDVRK